MMELGVKAELEVHDSGHVDFALQLLKAMNAPLLQRWKAIPIRLRCGVQSATRMP
jgi:uncharacterized protein (DUF849 family)